MPRSFPRPSAIESASAAPFFRPVCSAGSDPHQRLFHSSLGASHFLESQAGRSEDFMLEVVAALHHLCCALAGSSSRRLGWAPGVIPPATTPGGRGQGSKRALVLKYLNFPGKNTSFKQSGRLFTLSPHIYLYLCRVLPSFCDSVLIVKSRFH